jgi:hypothetical protein
MDDYRYNLPRRKMEGLDEWVGAHVRFDDDCKNGHQTFAITGTVWGHAKSTSERQWISGGCVHDDVARAFPPLAALANGAYWAQKSRGLYRVFDSMPFEDADPKAPGHFRSTVVWGAAPEHDTPEALAAILDDELPIDGPPDGVIFDEWRDSDGGKAQRAAEVAMRVNRWAIAREADVSRAFMQALEDCRDYCETVVRKPGQPPEAATV